jgi:hypothetical protein
MYACAMATAAFIGFAHHARADQITITDDSWDWIGQNGGGTGDFLDPSNWYQGTLSNPQAPNALALYIGPVEMFADGVIDEGPLTKGGTPVLSSNFTAYSTVTLVSSDVPVSLTINNNATLTASVTVGQLPDSTYHPTGPLLPATLYLVNGGSINGTIDVGANGTGVVVQSGGSISAQYINLGFGGNGNFTQNGGTNAITGELDLGGAASSTNGVYSGLGTGAYTLSAGSLSTTTENVAENGIGNFTQTGGTNLTGLLNLGTLSGASGSYSLSGTGLLSVGSNENIGYNGAGTFNQTGGTNTVTPSTPFVNNNLFTLGYLNGATGTYDLSGTGSLSASSEEVAINGTGNFNQFGGTNTVNSGGDYPGGGLYLGDNTNSTGNYTLSGNALLSVGSQELVGFYGTGNFTQTGGTNTVTDTGIGLELGGQAGATGTYTLSAGALSTSDETVGFLGIGIFNQSGGTNTAGGEFVGSAALGSYSQSGGTNTVSEQLAIGGFAFSGSGANTINYIGTGSYILSGNGTLSAGNEIVGDGGLGTFSQTGGTNTLSGSLTIGTYTNVANTYSLGTGNYTLRGGALSAGSEYVSYGTFTQTGGTNAITGNNGLLLVSANGTYTLSSGALTTPSLSIEGGATFNWTGGTLATTTVSQSGGTFIDPNELTIGSGAQIAQYRLYEGTLSVGSLSYSGTSFEWEGGTLNLTNTAIIGLNAPFGSTLILNDSQTLQVSTPGTSLQIAPGGTLNLAGGTLTIATLINSGRLNWTVGTVNFTNGLIIGTGGMLGASPVLNAGQTLAITGTLQIAVTGNLTLNGGTLTTDSFTNAGNLNWISGTLEFTDNLVVGAGGLLGSNLTLTSGMTLTANNTLTIATGGTLTLNGGEVDAGNLINSGQLHWNSGTLNLTNSNLTIGTGGALGSTVTISDGQALGVIGSQNALIIAPTGTLNLNGGTITINSFLNAGQFNWTCGALFINGPIIIDSVASNFGGGSFTLLSNQSFVPLDEIVGYSDTGTFTQTGGTNAPGELDLGENAGSHGTYTLSGNGFLLVSDESGAGIEIVGVGGTGTFTQTAGTNNPSELDLAENAASNGTYTLVYSTTFNGTYHAWRAFL